MASWFVCLSPDRAVRVQDLAGDIVLCSWAGHFTSSPKQTTKFCILSELSKASVFFSHIGEAGSPTEIKLMWKNTL